MAARDLWVRIRADVSGLQAGLAKATAGVRAFDASVQKSAAKRQAINDVGTAFGKVGLAAAAGLGLSVKAAVDWETAWTGVTKTVDGTTAQMAALEAELRKMARSLPATHTEIAAVAEAAGQLGVRRADIAAFTKVMIDLGETTNLTSDEAATSIAQLMNIMQTAPGEVDNLGAALVALGNDGASTERDIIQMAQNIAGAGKIVGLTEHEVLALANALASVGIEAEAGGSSISRIFTDMFKAVKTGGPDLALWAKTAGETQKSFRAMFQESPAAAFDAFVQGLGQISEEGGNVFAVMDKLGQKDIRVTKALLGMANSGDLLSESLKTGSQAWAENIALTEEAEKRYGTAASQMKVAWNGIKDNMIDIGAVALPVVAEFVEVIAGLTSAFSDLPKPLQGSVTKFLALTAALGGTAFVVSRAITSFAAMRATMVALGIATEATATRMLLMRGGLGLAGVGLASLHGPAQKSSDALGVLTSTAAGAALGFSVGGPWGAAIGAGAGALYGVVKASDDTASTLKENKQVTLDYADAFKQVGAAARAARREMVTTDLQKSGAFDIGRRLGIQADLLVDAAIGVKGAEKRLMNQVSKLPHEMIGPATTLLVKLGLVSEAFERGKRDGQEWRDAVSGTSPTIDIDDKAGPKIEGIDLALQGLDPLTALMIDADPTPANQKIKHLVAWINSQGGTVDADGNVKPGRNATKALLRWIEQQGGKVNVGADTSAAKAAVRAFKQGIGSVRIPILGRLGRFVADGGIFNGAGVQTFADGGENHVAQMAPAGAWRVWAEPETGGEAYIPFAASKRQRSREIAMQAVNKLGGVAHFADGGIGGNTASNGIDYDRLGRSLARGFIAEGAQFKLDKDNRSLQLASRRG
jgi:TP901 family phage tail tape measure protein